MGYVFAPGLSACAVSGTLVFLDVVNDRYFTLSEDDARACLDLIAEPRFLHSGPIDRLLSRGIVRRSKHDIGPRLCGVPPKVRRSARDHAGRSSSLLTGAAITRIVHATLHLKASSLSHALDRLRTAKAAMAGYAEKGAAVGDLAMAFASADRIIGPFNRCLPRSLAVSHAMVAAGLAPILVIAVKMRPFGAHCWVQYGDVLVSDDAAAIRPFTPILIL